MATAHFIRDIPSSIDGQDLRLYRLDPPMTVDGENVDHVIVSAKPPMSLGHVEFPAGTALFDSDAAGTWSPRGLYAIVELRDEIDHEKALWEAGYEVIAEIAVGTEIPGLGEVKELGGYSLVGVPPTYFVQGANGMGKWYTAQELSIYAAGVK